MMNTNTEMMIGMPSPPLRMMAPKGAPMKKKMMHCNARANLFCASSSWLRITRSLFWVIMALKSRSDVSLCTLLRAEEYTICCRSIFIFCRRLSRSIFPDCAILTCFTESFFDILGDGKHICLVSFQKARPMLS